MFHHNANMFDLTILYHLRKNISCKQRFPLWNKGQKSSFTVLLTFSHVDSLQAPEGLWKILIICYKNILLSIARN